MQGLWGWCSPIPQALPGKENYLAHGATLPTVKRILPMKSCRSCWHLALSKKMRTGSARGKTKCPKEGKWNTLNKFDEKNGKTWGQMLEKVRNPHGMFGAGQCLPSLLGPMPTRAGPTLSPRHWLQRGRPSPAAWQPRFSVGLLLAVSKKHTQQTARVIWPKQKDFSCFRLRVSKSFGISVLVPTI